jgi:hypothetical protein
MGPPATHETGHFYFAQTGHSHFAATLACPMPYANLNERQSVIDRPVIGPALSYQF